MGDQTQAYDIFQTPLSSGYPLPLSSKIYLITGREAYKVQLTGLKKDMVGVQRLCVKNALGPECIKCSVDRVEKRNSTISEPCLEKQFLQGKTI